jgi:creatinine amidohydrolase
MAISTLAKAGIGAAHCEYQEAVDINANIEGCPMQKWKLAEAVQGHIKDEQYEVAVLPVGALEAHGMHLPYATDTIQCEAIAELACERADEQGAKVLLLPAVPFSINENTLAFKWTISLRPSTLFRVVEDVVSSIEHHGIRKMVLLNGHGGNEFQPHLREMFRRTSVHIFLVNWYQCAPESNANIFDETGEHADEMETSMMLNLRPELVEAELAGDGSVREPVLTAMEEGWAWLARPWGKFTKDSAFGDPAAAQARKGEKYLEAIVGKISNLLVELSEAEVDEMFPYRSE